MTGTEARDYDVVVVGGGAAGLMAAIAAGEEGVSVLLLNSHEKPGLKILMSGGTRCNVTHAEVDPRSFEGSSRNAISNVLKSFPAKEVRGWFEEEGVQLKEEPGGKLFPVTDSAKTVLLALLAACERSGVTLRTGRRVTAVTGEGDRFRVTAGAESWEAGTVILTTGGLSFPLTGSDGGGYALARALGHTLVETIPALTPLVVAGDRPARLAGVTLPAALTLHRGTRRIVTRSGSLLFTHQGVSGPAALDLSRHWLREPPGTERRVTAHFRPFAAGEGDPDSAPPVEPIEADWLRTAQREPQTTVQLWFGRSLPHRLAREIAAEAEVDPVTPLPAVRREDRRRLLTLLTAFPLPVVDTLGYRKAEVTAGGVPLDEIDPRTMESRRTPALYLAGEILDVDGRLGGYNFQWAWSSGRLAGRSAARRARRSSG